MFLNSCRWRASVYSAVADLGQRHADDRDVGAEFRRRQRPGVVVEQVAARLDLGDVLVPGLRVHRHHQVDAAARAEMALLGDPHLVPGRQALDVGRKDVARRDGDAHAQDRLARTARVGAGRAGAVDVGELDDEVVDPLHRCNSGCEHAWPPVRRAAWAMSSRKRCMSQAPVGQRSAHRPQCRQTSSSFTITRPVFSPSGT